MNRRSLEATMRPIEWRFGGRASACTRRAAFCFVLALALTILAKPGECDPTAGIPTPEESLGFRVGEDGKLADYHQILDYLKSVANRSDRVELQEYGRSTLDQPLAMVLVSSPENLASAERYRDISRRLANPQGLSSSEAERLIRDGKVILLITCNIHSDEIATSQVALEWVHELAITTQPHVLEWLAQVIVLFVPSVNPDGQIMVTEWYREQAGTAFEGSPMPWLYHKYAGHDLNRDWYMLTQKETRALNRVAYHEWYPQVLVDEHQMGSTGPRVFVPPYANPVAANVHPLIWRLTALIGNNMALRLEEARKPGVISGYTFDGYWVGGTRTTCFWKNTVGILTEVASARVASPIHIDPMELRGDRKGLPEYQAQVNFPNPWTGGWWRLRDIIDYHLIFTNSVLETCARHREDLLRDRLAMARDAIKKGESEAPYGFAIPVEQHDPSSARWMVDLLRENGLEASRAVESFQVEGETFAAGTVVFRSAQPNRPFLKEMLEEQSYPEIPYGPGSEEIYLPYDVTGWTLSLLMGVQCTPLNAPLSFELQALDDKVWPPLAQADGVSELLALHPGANASHRAVNRVLARGQPVWRTTREFTLSGESFPAGTWLVRSPGTSTLSRAAHELGLELHELESLPEIELFEIQQPRVGIVKPWWPSMDEGWTRWVLETFEFKVSTLDNRAVRSGRLHQDFDVIIVPTIPRQILVDGARGSAGSENGVPPDYSGGIGMTGLRHLRKFMEDGGTLVLQAPPDAALLKDLELQVENAVEGLEPAEYSFPGTLVRLQVDAQHPLGFGMPAEVAAYHRDGPAFVTRPGAGPLSRQVVARFPNDKSPLVMSGWGRGERHLRGWGAVVELQVGQGKAVLIAPRVQHRGQTHATFKLLFNAIQQSAARLQPKH